MVAFGVTSKNGQKNPDPLGNPGAAEEYSAVAMPIYNHITKLVKFCYTQALYFFNAQKDFSANGVGQSNECPCGLGFWGCWDGSLTLDRYDQ